MMAKTVWPWDAWLDFKARYLLNQYEFISAKLKEAGLQPKNGDKPLESWIKDAEGVISALGMRPVVLVMSGNQRLLSTLEHLVLQAIAFTMQKSVASIDTIDLANLFRARRPSDIWQSDPSGEQVDYLKRVYCVGWNRFDEAANRQRDLAGLFSQFVRDRLDHHKITMITALSTTRGPKCVEFVQKTCDSHYNRTLKNILLDDGITAVYHTCKALDQGVIQ